MTDANPSSVPFQSQEIFQKQIISKTKGNKKMQAIPHASACGSLMYAMVSTRPDIAYAAAIRRFMSQPGRSHWAIVKSILRYLKCTNKERYTMENGT